MKPETKGWIGKNDFTEKDDRIKAVWLMLNLEQQHTGKMYFSGRKSARRFPKTCEAEQRPVIQLKAAALFCSSTTSAYKGRENVTPNIPYSWSSITEEQVLPHKQRQCRKYSLDLEYKILYEEHSKHIQILQTDSRQV